LHGYHGSAQALRGQLAPLAVGLETFVELVFLDAPSLALGDYGWWHARSAGTPSAWGDAGVDGTGRRYDGWPRTRAAILAAWARLGPFDGIFGFSQGAALTGLLVGLRAPDGATTVEHPLSFDFAIMVGGFAANDPALGKLYERRDSYALPSLHLLGRSDGVVPARESLALASKFDNALVVEHAGGHVIASEPGVRSALATFLGQRLLALSERVMEGKEPQ
jgi:hypothetical protein